MKDYKELEVEVMKIVANNELPEEIRDSINRFYIQYRDVCDDYVHRVGALQDIGNMESIMRLRHIVEQEYEKCVVTINQVIDRAYEDKYSKVMQRITSITFSKEQEGIDRKNIFPREDNKNFIQVVQQAFEKQLTSSKMNILTQTPRNYSSLEYKLREKQIQENFESEIDRILTEITKEFPEVGKILEKQDEKKHEEISKVLAPNELAKQREEFVRQISQGVVVNEEEAKRKVEKQQERENNRNQALPGNVIE